MVARTSETLNQAAEAELADLKEKVETLMTDHVTPIAKKVAGQAEAVAQDAVTAVRRNRDSLVDEVRARPLTSLGLAVAAGFVLAHVLRR